MPEEKKISKYRIYKCPWNIGDVYACKIEESEEYKNKYICFIKVLEDEYYPHNICPVVYVYNKIFDEIPKIEELKGIKYLPQFYVPEAYKGEYKNVLYKSLIGIGSYEKRYVKEYIHIGNIENYAVPNNEINYDEYSYFCFAKEFIE